MQRVIGRRMRSAELYTLYGMPEAAMSGFVLGPGVLNPKCLRKVIQYRLRPPSQQALILVHTFDMAFVMSRVINPPSGKSS